MMSEQSNKSDDQPTLDELITLSEAAELSGLSTRHLRHLAIHGEIWAKKYGRNWLTTARSVEQYIARERKPGPKPQIR